MRFAALLLTVLVAAAAGPAIAQLPALRDRPLSAAERTRLTALEAQLARVSQQRSLSVNAVRAIAQALGERLTTQDPDQLIRAIDERAQELGAARGQISALERDLEAMDSMRLAQAVGPLLTAANAAIEAGELSTAEARLAEAAQRFADARQNLQGRVDQLAGREAEIIAQRAAVRGSVFDSAAAATLYAQAAEIAPASDREARWRYRLAEARSLFGDYTSRGDAAVAERALAVARDQALPLAPATGRSRERAETHYWLAVTQYGLGRARNDLTLLAVAGQSAAAALEAMPADGDPQTRADLDVLQAETMRAIGAARSDLSLVEGALPFFQRAAEVSGPKQWERLTAYAGAQADVAQRGGTAASLAQAAETLERAARALPGDVSVRQAGNLHANRWAILTLLAQAAPSAAAYERAAEAARTGLGSASRSEHPAVWALGRQQVGQSLTALSEQQGPTGAATLEQAIAEFRAVGEVYTRDANPGQWVALQDALAEALLARGRRQTGTAGLEEAAAVYRGAIQVATRERAPAEWSFFQTNLGAALVEMADRDPASGTARLAEARTLLSEAQPIVRQSGHAGMIALNEQTLARIGAAPALAPPP